MKRFMVALVAAELAAYTLVGLVWLTRKATQEIMPFAQTRIGLRDWLHSAQTWTTATGNPPLSLASITSACPQAGAACARVAGRLYLRDGWGTRYGYLATCEADNPKVRVRSAGPDRVFSTPDDLEAEGPCLRPDP